MNGLKVILLLAKTDNADLISDLIACMFSFHELSIKEVVEANFYSKLSIEEFEARTDLSMVQV